MTTVDLITLASSLLMCLWLNNKQAWGFPEVRLLILLTDFGSSTSAAIWFMTVAGNFVIDRSPLLYKAKSHHSENYVAEAFHTSISLIVWAKNLATVRSRTIILYWTIFCFQKCIDFLFLHLLSCCFLERLSNWHAPIYPVRSNLTIISTGKAS